MSAIASNRKPLKLTWHIQEYSTCIQTLGEGIESSRFEIESLGPISWCLVFYPGGYENPKYAACFLQRCGGCRIREALVDLEICLKSENGAENFLKTTSNLLFLSEGSLGFPEFVTFEELERCPFSNDVLTLQCYISPSIDTKYVIDFVSLSNDIQLLHEETTFYDVIIRTDKKEFKVHKPLLIARFPSLVHKIERSHYEESIPFVVISDFSDEIVFEVLHFVYTGKLTKNCENRLFRSKLEKFASKYDMENLLSKLKWDVDECTMYNRIKHIAGIHKLFISRSDVTSKVEKSLPLSRLGASETNLNLQYLIYSDLVGINFGIKLTIETNSKRKYSLLVKLESSFVSDYHDESVSYYEHSINMNNFDSESDGESGTVPSQWVSFFVANEILVKNGNLQHVYMAFEWNVSFIQSTIETLPMITDTLTRFSDDMSDLFRCGIGTDLVLVTISDGTEFKVHKSVVCARVPSIMTMFKGDTLAVNGYVHDDLKDLKVDIPDVDSNTFRAILEYIYSGKIDESTTVGLHPKLVQTYMRTIRNRNGENRNILLFRKQREIVRFGRGCYNLY